MTRIPLDPLTHRVTSDTRAGSGDTHVLATGGDSRFGDHLRRAERKPGSFAESESAPRDAAEPRSNAGEPEHSPTPDRGSLSPQGDEKKCAEPADSTNSRSTDEEDPTESAAEETAAAVCASETVVSAAAPILGIESTLGDAPFDAGAVQAANPSAEPVDASRGGGTLTPSGPTRDENDRTTLPPDGAETPSHETETSFDLENTTIDTTGADSRTAGDSVAQAEGIVSPGVPIPLAAAVAPGAEGKPADSEPEKGKDDPMVIDRASAEGAGTGPPADVSRGARREADGFLDSGSGRRERDPRGEATAGSSRPAAFDASVASDAASELVANAISTGDGNEAADTSGQRGVSVVATAVASNETAPQAARAQVAPETASGSASTTAEPDSTDASRFIRRVAGAFEAVGRRGEPIRIQLTPPEMGTLRLEIKVERGEITARLETDTQDARNLLLDNLSILRNRLEQQDIRINRFDVEYNAGSDGSGPTPEDWTSRQRNRDSAPRDEPRQPAGETENQPRTSRIAEVTADGRINLYA